MTLRGSEDNGIGASDASNQLAFLPSRGSGLYSDCECNDNECFSAFLIEKDDTSGIVKLNFSGKTGLRVVVQATDRIMEGGRIVATRRLFDFRRADVDFSPDDISRISDRSISKEPGNSRIALLVRGDLQYGLGAMFGGLAWGSSRQIRVFRDEAEAVAWLTSEE